jgi:hypothetical protein
MVSNFRLEEPTTGTGTFKNYLIDSRKKRRLQKIVSNLRLKVEFDLESRFPGIAARKRSMLS